MGSDVNRKTIEPGPTEGAGVDAVQTVIPGIPESSAVGPMRVAVFVNQFPSMSQTFVLSQITTLMDQGHHVDIYARTRGSDACIHQDVIRYKLRLRTHYWLRPRGVGIGRFLRGVGLIGASVLRNPRVVLLGLRSLRYRRMMPWTELYCAMIGISRHQNKYDVIHCHFGPNGLTAAIMRELGVIQGKLLTTFHGYDVTRHIERCGRDAYEFLFDRAECLLTVSDQWKSRLMELGCPSEKILVHRVGIQCGRFRYAPRTLRDEEKVRLISIARLVEKKGLEYVIRAVAELLPIREQVEFEIVGDGPLRPRLQQLVDELGLRELVKFSGWKDQEQVIAALENAHILVAPSVTADDGDQEGIPVVLMEAMAMGLPIVSTWHSGIPELVQDGISGLLVPERDVYALRTALEYLCEHPHLWPRFGEAGRRYVELHHDLDTQNRRLEELYRGTGALPGCGSGGFLARIRAEHGGDWTDLGGTRDPAPFAESDH